MNRSKKAIIIGCSTGIGRELAKRMAYQGYELGLADPKEDLMKTLQQEIASKTHAQVLDVTSDSSRTLLQQLINQMGGVDIVVICAGIGDLNPTLDFEIDKKTIDVNVTGFCAMATTAMRHFLHQGQGHLVAISSIAGMRGNDGAPAYNASKAFIINYLEGLRKKVTRTKLGIVVTDIRPGFVDTAMAKTQDSKPFWMISASKAAHYIFKGIEKKKKIVYVSPRWRLVAWALKVVPDWVYFIF
jgi:short-subunit dehydrogenase